MIVMLPIYLKKSIGMAFERLLAKVLNTKNYNYDTGKSKQPDCKKL